MNEEGNDKQTSDSAWGTSNTQEPRMAGPLDAVRKAALAGIGAVAVATEATDEIFEELVKKGEETREEAIREFKEARARSQERASSATGFFRSRMDGLLNKMNLPSKADVDSINAKLNILTRKVDDVQSSHVGDPVKGSEAPGGESDA